MIAKRKILKIFTILVIFLTSYNQILSSQAVKHNNEGFVDIESNEAVLTEISDRFAIINWTIPTNLTYNGFIIRTGEPETNTTEPWTAILLTDDLSEEDSFFSLVNYTIAGEIVGSPKSYSSNFTYYQVPRIAETIQVKITGLLPETSYIFHITIANISIIEDNQKVIIIENENSWWVSSSITTLTSIDENLNYSKTATLLSLGVIITIFAIVYIFIAKRDVPFNRMAYLFIFPALFALVLLEIYPMLYGIILSFTSYHLERGERPTFNFLNNYANIAENPQLSITLTTTLVWSTIIIFLKILLGFVIAYLIQYKIRRKKLWYLFLYLPWAIPSYIKILSWRTFFHGNSGDSFFNILFGTNVNLVSQPYVALFVACFVEIWDSLPFITTIFLGALASIPKEFNEIAEVDQIPERTRIRKIVLPLIKPIILPVIILEIIKSFGSFNVAFLLTKGYPLLPYGISNAGVVGATDLFSTFTFYMFYQQREIGIAAAYSVIMSLLSLFFVIAWVKMSKGTKSAYRPEKQKSSKTRLATVFIIFPLIQIIAYTTSKLTNFRYFGIFWSDASNYIVVGLYFIVIICFAFKRESAKSLLKGVIIVDLILSFLQFFFYQMWYAFNWAIFLSVVVLYLQSNISRTEHTNAKFLSIDAIGRFYGKIKQKVSIILSKIDRRFVEPNSIQAILLIQSIGVLLALVIEKKNWIAWLYFVIVILMFIFSLFSRRIVQYSPLLQPFLVAGLILSKFSAGWIIIFTFTGIATILKAIQNSQNRRKILTNKNSGNKTPFKIYPIFSVSFLTLISVIALIPLFNVIWIAFAPYNQIVPNAIFPKNPTLDNFKLLFTDERIYLHFGNSLLVSFGSALISIGLTILAAYAFSRFTFNLKNKLMVGVFILKMFTGILTLVPLYLIIFNLGLVDSFIGVMLTFSTRTIPIGLWIMKGYFDSIPTELDESALIMGNSPTRVIRKIILPLSGPAIAIAFLLNFLSAWNGFLLAFVLLQSPEKYTLPIKLYTFLGSVESNSPEWGLFAAASILVIIPLMLIFLLLRKHILRGLDSQNQMNGV